MQISSEFQYRKQGFVFRLSYLYCKNRFRRKPNGRQVPGSPIKTLSMNSEAQPVSRILFRYDDTSDLKIPRFNRRGTPT